MIVISDTSPISNLAAIGQLDLLRQIYGEVIIPETVYQEIINGGITEPATLAVQSLEWIKKASVNNFTLVRNLLSKLDPGEAEAIVLALELNAELLIVDERKGRKQATSLGLKITGTFFQYENHKLQSNNRLNPRHPPQYSSLAGRPEYRI